MKIFATGIYLGILMLIASTNSYSFDRSNANVDSLRENPDEIFELLREQQKEFDEVMSAREVAQAIAIAEFCEIELDSRKVSDFTQRMTRENALPESRMMFQLGGRAQKRRFESMNDIEKAAACGSALGTAERFNLLAE